MAIFYLDYELGNDANDGSDWANAWKTITNGPTAARIAPGDIIKIAKSPAPTALAGTTATWTDLSKTVTLNAAETATITNCETAWTGSANVTATLATSAIKEGSGYAQISIAAGFTTGKAAYFTINETNFSAYQKISLWLRVNTALGGDDRYKICLCSDTVGDTIVDTFNVPIIIGTNRYLPLTLTKDGGGNLGSSIKSIAFYVNTDEGARTFLLDNIIACTTNGLNLQSLISKNSLEQGGTEGWYGIQSIDGITVLLDNDSSSSPSTARGYSGTTETVNTYKRETIKTPPTNSTSTDIQAVQNSGTVGNNIQFQGGYDTTTGNQTGETFFDGLNGFGRGINIDSKSYITLNRLNTVRYTIGFRFGSCNYITVQTISSSNNVAGIFFSSSSYINIETITNVNNNNTDGVSITASQKINIGTIINANNNNSSNGAIYIAGDNNIIDTISNVNNNVNAIYIAGYKNTINTASNVSNNSNAGVIFRDSKSDNIIKNLSTAGNSSGTLGISCLGGKNYIYNATITETTKANSLSSLYEGYVFIQKLNGGYSAIYPGGGDIVSQASTLTAGSGTEWKFTTHTDSSRQLDSPLKLSIAKIAVVANKEVTVTCYFKKGHATNIGARLVFPAQLGETEHYATCPDDTTENNLSISFTPTETGVCEIEAWAYYIAGHSTVIVDGITITQAD